MDRLAGERPARPDLRRASSHLGLLRASRGILLHLFCRFFFIHCGFFSFLPCSTSQLPEPATCAAGEAGGRLEGVMDGRGGAGCSSQGHVQHFNWSACTDFLTNSIF